jgi:iron complex outermembrane recepter protein
MFDYFFGKPLSAFGFSAIALAAVWQAQAQQLSGADAQPAPANSASSSAEGPSGRGGQSSDVGTLEAIVVTAQKRSQSINSVGMSISALKGNELIERGLTNLEDLAKAIPGFTFSETADGTPVYTLRGVGFIDQSLAASPAVSIYYDEVPLPFSVMSRGPALDLERIEVLKGPQGTLYGQNATGGAFNYIAAKPTDTFQAGESLSYGRFSTTDFQGFLSGPINDTLNGRIAFRTIQGGDWQHSYTRNDHSGQQNQSDMRILLDWKPIDRLKVSFNLSGWLDFSDTQMPQLEKVTPQVPSAVSPQIANYPVAPSDPQAADWTPGSHARNDHFWQASGRADYLASDRITVTSILAYQEYRAHDDPYDNDAMIYSDGDRVQRGHVKSYYEETRVAGDMAGWNWVVGENYAKQDTFENFTYLLKDASNATTAGYFFNSSNALSINDIKSYAVFGNAEYKLLDNLTLQGGARYTRTDHDGYSCGQDPGNGQVAALFTFLESIFKGGGPVAPIPPGACYTLDANFNPGLSHGELREHNVSWRGGLNWTPIGDTLLYLNVSKGYKAGSIPAYSASSYIQLQPIPQESLLAYEVGFKTPLLGNTLQLNGAGFYYDYANKQIFGLSTDPIFGVIQKLVSIPRSDIRGGELELVWRPVRGLNISAAATYLDTRIDRFIGFNASGQTANFKGAAFPYASKWQTAMDAQYTFPIDANRSVFLGGDVTSHSQTTAAFGDNTGLFAIRPYALLDLRTGVESSDGKWRVTLWGRNVTNRFYLINVEREQDATIRYTGMPLTYGATFEYNYK